MTDHAIIGGSGLDALPDFEPMRTAAHDTPYGAPSAAISRGRLGVREWLFLPRHGADHAIAPHRINYRANLFALKQCGIAKIIAVAAVGAIADYPPGTIVIPDQLIDYTWGRAHTFYDGAVEGGMDESLRHIEFSNPFSESLRAALIDAAKKSQVAAIKNAVYAATQGPRLETAAEIDRLQRDGAQIVGMTAMPEAALARELELEYAVIAMVVNAAAGRGAPVEMAAIEKYLQIAAHKALAMIAQV